jgi:hypothetical protein
MAAPGRDPRATATPGAAWRPTGPTPPKTRVLAHYRQALAAGSWTVEPPVPLASGREFRSGELTARRGDDTTTVLYESGPALVGGGTHVAVHVSRD